MSATSNRARFKRLSLPLGLAGIIAAALVAGTGVSITADAKPSPDRTAAQAQDALAKGKVDKAIELTEDLVAAAPRETAYRTLLGNSYLRAGRFESAIQAFGDAMKLGDNSARTALSLALAQIGAGRDQEAVATLEDWRDALPAADFGLALALAGQTGRGVAILTDTLRSGENTPKVRQNLAYAFALDGRWREARLMASQDLPANLVDQRLGEWASHARPEDGRVRVAAMLQVPVRSDAGQPAALALVDGPATPQLAAETATTNAPAAAAAPATADGELPPQGAAPAHPTVDLAQYQPALPAAAAPAPVAAPVRTTFVSQPVIQAIPASARSASARPAVMRTRVAVAAPASRAKAVRPQIQRIVAPTPGASGTHLVQLGSFLSEQGARRAWGVYVAKNPELKKSRMTITQANVRGKTYWRVAAAGFDARSANGMCSAVKARGGMCFAYAAVPAVRGAAGPVMAEARRPVPKVAFGGAAARRR